MRRGVGLVEVTIALAIGSLMTVIVYQAIQIMLRREKTTDRESARALAEARMMTLLEHDVRSARTVTPAGTGYTIVRWDLERDRFVERTVNWKVDRQVVTRTIAGDPGRPQSFSFEGTLDAGLAYKLRMEKKPDVRPR